MSAPLLYRVAGPAEVEGDGLTVVGLAAPYGQVTVIDDGRGPYAETIDRGAFTQVVERWPARRLKVQMGHPVGHGQGAWVGRGQEWRDEPEGLRVVLRLDDTHDGHSAAYKVRDGQTPAMSIAFVPGRSERVRNADGVEVLHRRTVRAIGHVALVPAGAYPSALVEAVRGAPTVVEVPEAAAPRRDALMEWLGRYDRHS